MSCLKGISLRRFISVYRQEIHCASPPPPCGCDERAAGSRPRLRHLSGSRGTRRGRNPSADNAYAFTARLDIGDGKRACSATLVDRDWLLTAASCFADNPAAAQQLLPGAPKDATTAVVGRTDGSTAAGQVRTVVRLVPRADRDLVLARLSKPVTTIAPAALATTAPTAGETLTGTGYGRTADEWAPVRMHQGRFSVDGSDATSVSITGVDGAAVCARRHRRPGLP